MLLLFFSYLSLSNLDKNDNPYEILGVSNTASRVEIREAYQKLVKLYHPDRNKSPNAEKTFMKINDAYELLKDPRQRLIYDQTGSKDAENNYEEENPFGNIVIQPDSSIESISLENLDDHLDKCGIAFVLIYSNEVGFLPLIESYNEIVSRYSRFISFYKNLTTDEYPGFGSKFGITKYPSILYIKKKDITSITHADFDSIYEYEHVEFPLDDSMIEIFMDACFNIKVSHFKTFDKAKNWILSSYDHTRVLILERSKKPSLKAQYIAAKFGTKAKFAVLSNDFVQMIRQLHLTNFPEALIFRGNSQNPNGTIGKYITVDNINDDTISEHVNALFVQLDKNSMQNECLDYCIVKIGDKPQIDSPEMTKFSKLLQHSFAYLPVNSALARSINATTNQFYLFEGFKRRYALLPDTDHLSDYVSKRNIGKLEMKNISKGIEGDSSFKDELNKFYRKSVRYIKLHLGILDTIFGVSMAFISEHPLLVTILYYIFSEAIHILNKILYYLTCGHCFNNKKKKNNTNGKKQKTS